MKKVKGVFCFDLKKFTVSIGAAVAIRMSLQNSYIYVPNFNKIEIQMELDEQMGYQFFQSPIWMKLKLARKISTVMIPVQKALNSVRTNLKLALKVSRVMVAVQKALNSVRMNLKLAPKILTLQAKRIEVLRLSFLLDPSRKEITKRQHFQMNLYKKENWI